MNDAVIAKLRQGRPVELNEEEAAFLVESLREAMATTLDIPASKVSDDVKVFEELGLDSIDVFDILDQLSQRFEVQVAMEEMPESVLRGGEQATFRSFADGLLAYFRQPPAPLERP